MTSTNCIRAGLLLMALAPVGGCQAPPAGPPARRAEQPAKPGGKSVIPISRQMTVEEPAKVDVTPVAIRPSPAETLPPARPEPDYPMPFGNAAFNSRLPGSLPQGIWRIAWEAPVNASLPPQFVAEAGNRVLAEGSGAWQLFDTRGTRIAEGRYGPSNVVLDPGHSLLYFVDSNNFVVAQRMADGRKEFMTSAAFGDNFARPLLARRGNRLIVAGVEQEGYPHRPTPANRSLLEFIEMADRLEVDSSGLLFSITGAAKLYAETTRLKAALEEETVVFAVPRRVYLASTDLRVKTALEGDFEPLLLSLDEAGRIYLVVTQSGRRALWILSPDGRRLADVALKPEWDPLIAPPIVGYDHRVFLVSREWLAAISPAGSLLWAVQPGAAPVAGAAISADGLLLASAGPELLAFDARGSRRVLRTFEGETLLTNPVLNARGQILVASGRKLYCLVAQR